MFDVLMLLIRMCLGSCVVFDVLMLLICLRLCYCVLISTLRTVKPLASLRATETPDLVKGGARGPRLHNQPGFSGVRALYEHMC